MIVRMPVIACEAVLALSAADGDFEDGQVPDEHDPDYAFCASRVALDGAIIANRPSSHPARRYSRHR
jgi:hypothetical protein